jgi:hypothetical protein
MWSAAVHDSVNAFERASDFFWVTGSSGKAAPV